MSEVDTLFPLSFFLPWIIPALLTSVWPSSKKRYGGMSLLVSIVHQLLIMLAFRFVLLFYIHAEKAEQNFLIQENEFAPPSERRFIFPHSWEAKLFQGQRLSFMQSMQKQIKVIKSSSNFHQSCFLLQSFTRFSLNSFILFEWLNLLFLYI